MLAAGRSRHGEVVLAVQAEEGGQVVVGTGVEQGRRPAQGGGRVADVKELVAKLRNEAKVLR